MKKLLALFLTICMLFTVFALAGCDNSNPDDDSDDDDKGSKKQDYHELANDAIDDVLNAKSYHMTADVSMKQNLNGNVSEMSLHNIIKAMDMDKDSAKVLMESNQNYGDYESSSTHYYENGYMYFFNGPDAYNYKESVDFDEVVSVYIGLDSVFYEMDEELFEDVEGKSVDEGTKVVLELDSDTAKELFEEIISSLMYNIVGDDLSQVEVKNAEITIVLDDEELVSYKISFKAEYSIGDDSVSYEYSAKVTIKSLNGSVEITPPEGYESYPEDEWG